MIGFVAMAFGGYAKYVPHFAYSAHRAEPGSKIKVFLDSKPGGRIQHDIENLRKGGVDLEIDTTTMQEYQWMEKVEPGKQLLQAFRWILPREKLPKTRYNLICDIDIFFLREGEGIEAFHKDRMKRTGLAFSNVLRKGQKRLTGIHCIDKPAYYEIVGLAIKHAHRPASFKKFINGTTTRGDADETFLANLVGAGYKYSLDIDYKELMKHERKRPWHGLHLGAARTEIDAKKVKTFLTISLDEAGAQLLEIFHDDLFWQTSIFKEATFRKFADFIGVNGWLKSRQ